MSGYNSPQYLKIPDFTFTFFIGNLNILNL